MRPRVGFLGVGWIGRHRMDALAASGTCEVAAVADAVPDAAAEVAAAVGVPVTDAAALLAGDLDVDAVVIATPSALHADQSVQALAAGLAVFCQKPLGRSLGESTAVVDAARTVDRLLDVDLSYRHVRAARRAREIVAGGEIGDVYAVDVVFHNAYGPDKAWYRDPGLAGGGCVIDLGIHLVDLALWTLDWPKVDAVTSRLFAGGRPVGAASPVIEDHAVARLDLADGAMIRLACSWNLHAGCDAVIEATYHGVNGSVVVQNVGGSFYDFVCVRNHGTAHTVVDEGPDEWGGGAIVDWGRRLATSRSFDHSVEPVLTVAEVIDRIYGR